MSAQISLTDSEMEAIQFVIAIVPDARITTDQFVALQSASVKLAEHLNRPSRRRPKK